MDINTIIIYVACIIFLFIFGRIFVLPLRSIFKIVGNSILGGILLFCINSIGGIWGFHIGLNVLTALLEGLLGIPRCYFINYFENFFIKNDKKVIGWYNKKVTIKFRR